MSEQNHQPETDEITNKLAGIYLDARRNLGQFDWAQKKAEEQGRELAPAIEKARVRNMVVADLARACINARMNEIDLAEVMASLGFEVTKTPVDTHVEAIMGSENHLDDELALLLLGEDTKEN